MASESVFTDDGSDSLLPMMEMRPMHDIVDDDGLDPAYVVDAYPRLNRWYGGPTIVQLLLTVRDVWSDVGLPQLLCCLAYYGWSCLVLYIVCLIFVPHTGHLKTLTLDGHSDNIPIIPQDFNK